MAADFDLSGRVAIVIGRNSRIAVYPMSALSPYRTDDCFLIDDGYRFY
jgi:hypothetical protein